MWGVGYILSEGDQLKILNNTQNKYHIYILFNKGI